MAPSSIFTHLDTKQLFRCIEDELSIRQGMPQIRHSEPAFTLVLGSGFSYGVVPTTAEMMRREVGPSLTSDVGSEDLPLPRKEELTRGFWRRFADENPDLRSGLRLDGGGLPEDPAAAYQMLFDRRAIGGLANREIAHSFLRSMLGKAHDRLNGAHFFLGALLYEQQQRANLRRRPLCRTIFTTNFDPLLQAALQFFQLLYYMTDRPDRMIDRSGLDEEESAIHLIYTHGSIFRPFQANSEDEIKSLSDNADAFASYFDQRHIIVLGYAGWRDSIMEGLRHRTTRKKSVYWCDIKSPERAAVELNEDVRKLFADPNSGFKYVSLGAEGADAFMADLYRHLYPEPGYPRLLSNPFPLLVDRLEKMQLGNVRLFRARTPAQAAGSDGASEGPPAQSDQGPTADVHLGHLVARLRAFEASWTGAPAPTANPPTPERPNAEDVAPPIPGPQTLALDAEAATAAGRWSDAIAAWDRVLDHPDTTTGLQAQAFASRGYCRGQLRDSQAEIEDYTAAIELPGAPPDQVARSLVNRGITLGQAGETIKALTDFTAAIELPGASPERVAWALVSRGLLYNSVAPHNPKRAMADFTRAVDLPGAPPDRVVHALMARGLTQARPGDAEGAIQDYTQAIELPGASSHDVAEALVLRGRARFQDGRGDAAAFRQDCEAAISKEDSPVRRFWLGHALLFEGRDSAALDAYRRGLEQAPTRADIIDATKRIHAGIQSEWLSSDRAAPVLRLLDQARLQSRGPASDQTALP